ncbi:asparagine synthase (glutamine-hydrolyzing) [Geomonas sp. RF6]|uniref:asparagine synthase (glutamine-hydrolyzing) n=1 Tax=Geomonas sp. RF6 TaxID=2897342 RepID=UPI001E53129A|nr:asparagine synthase (glutamine-hydrolyzing) [Geomonas sp. RF6]UFS69125.1 asparagine synthase (glutamine-hydrolyzing) [Geomonas sp. RF6]
MCGIAGFFRSCAPEADEAVLRQMGEVMRHRGPDASGEFLDDHVGLSHRRLSILDLSPLGNQPMHSADGNLVIVFNGEIYNFLELRAELERSGVSFRSRTDTEVILALYARHGVRSLEMLNGMFAFALWDRAGRKLLLARDRIGKKPLYYCHLGGDRLAFASEIKSLLVLPEVGRKIEPTAIADYLKYLYIPAPKTIYRGIYKLPPAHSLELSVGGEPRVSEYWDVSFKAASRSAEEAEGRLLELLQESTSCRMIADVPLGAFLSGGVDSSAVVALMSRAAREPVKTCSIGFADKRHDETPFAREVAAAFGTDHREYLVQENLAATAALMPKFFDEPFADSSALPTYHVSRLARRFVTVALAGDGGDESFGGYSKYLVELKEELVRKTVPRPLLALLASGARTVRHPVARKVRSLTTSALCQPARAYYRTNTFIEDDLLEEILAAPVRRACTGYDPGAFTERCFRKVAGADHVTSMLYTDLKTYLPGDILVKVDRMSMAHSLEVRAPFLDYRVVEFAAALPTSCKISAGQKKVILKRVFGPLLPESVFNRPKQGFTVPLDCWFRSELKGLAEESLLREEAMGEYLDRAVVRRIWEEHQDGRENHGTLLWALLMLALWHRAYLGGHHV